MCKIAVIPGLSDETTPKAWEFIKKLGKEMAGYSDDDGFGYAAIDAEGKMFGERWFNPKEAFSNREEKNKISEANIKKFKGMLKGKQPVYNYFGEVHENSLRCAMLHARNATSEKIFKNTHPFVIDGTALIHNGIIRNDAELEKKVSTCDSEVILTEYIKQDVANDIKAIQTVAHKLDGYYAVGLMAKTAEGQMIIDVFKDRGAKLRAYFIKELNTVVFATPGATENYGPIHTVCRDMHLTIMDEYEVEDSRIVRMDAMTGEVIDSIPFDSTYKEKAGKKGKKGGGSGHGANHNVHYPSNVHDQWQRQFGASGKSQRSFAEKQKDDELERELIDGVCYADGFTGLNEDTPALPEGQSTASKYNYHEDWYEDESGIWHRKVDSDAV